MPSILDQLLGTSTVTERQQTLNCGEAQALWNTLVFRYDFQEANDLYGNFANDIEWKAILAAGQRILSEEVAELEKMAASFGIPMPPRPPKFVNTPGNTEVLRDEFCFRTVYMGIQYFIDEHSRSLKILRNHQLRELLLKMKFREMELFERMSDYGRIKGWLMIPPAYNLAK